MQWLIFQETRFIQFNMTKKKKLLDYDRVLYQTEYRLQQGDLKSFPSSVSDQCDNFHKSHRGRLGFLHLSSWGSDQRCALWHSTEWIYCLIMLGTAELFQLGKFQSVAWRNFNLRAKSGRLTVRPRVPEAIQMQIIKKKKLENHAVVKVNLQKSSNPFG